MTGSRIAALYDIHGNLPALNAVLAEFDREAVDVIVIGGDVAAGPQPRETIARLRALGGRARFVRGNADREVVEAYDEGRTDHEHERDPADQAAAFAAGKLGVGERDFLAGFAPTVSLDVEDLGPVLFCHGSPRSDTEIITSQTPPARLRAILGTTTETLIVGGHTHRQCEHRTGSHRYVNAGSVGAPYEGRPGAFWALLGPEVQWRRTVYETDAAAAQLRATGYPGIDEMLDDSLFVPVDADETAMFFERLATAPPSTRERTDR